MVPDDDDDDDMIHMMMTWLAVEQLLKGRVSRSHSISLTKQTASG